MKTVETFVNELTNLHTNFDTRYLFPMNNDCYTTLVSMQRDCYGITTLEDLNLHKYEPQEYFGPDKNGISPFDPIDSSAVLKEWNIWWNNKIISMGYPTPTEFLLDHGLELVNGNPILGDITWNQHHFASQKLWLGEFDVNQATQVMIYDGEKWLDRKVRRWSHTEYLQEIDVASNGVFRLSTS